MDDKAWVFVTIYGPQPEIDRFKRWFVVKSTDPHDSNEFELDFTGLFRHKGRYNHTLESHGEKPWGFQDWEQDAPGCYRLKFDTSQGLPEELFKHLVETFPHLMFDCEYIESDNHQMGYGWYNGPRDGDKFAYFDVPADYWTSSVSKVRDEASEARHSKQVKRVARAARRASERAAASESR